MYCELLSRKFVNKFKIDYIRNSQIYQTSLFFVVLRAERRFFHTQQVTYRIEIVRFTILLTNFFLRELVPIINRKRSVTRS